MQQTEREPAEGPTPSGHVEPDAGAGGRRGPVPVGLLAASLLAAAVLVIAFGVALSGGSDQEGDGDGKTILGGEGTLASDRFVPRLDGVDVTGQPVPSGPLQTLEGGELALTEFEGTPLVVNFYASTCAPCIREMPAFERVRQDLGGTVAFVGVNVLEGPEAGREMAELTGVTYPLVSDPAGDLINSFGAIGLPTTALVDPSGTILAVYTGEMEESELRGVLASHFGVGSSTDGEAG